jgi:Flp pilus assembly protein TadG
MRIDVRGRVRSLLARFRRDRRGVVAVMLAILLPVVIGAVELGVEPGVWYAIVRQDQSAADAAAITAAYEIAAELESTTGAATPLSAEATSAAARDATRNGFNASANVPTINCPPTSAAPAGTSWPSCALPTSSNPQGAAIEVVLSQQESALLPSVLSSLTLGARAVAQLTTQAQACALALGTTGTVIQVNAQLNLAESPTDACALAANSTDPSAIAVANAVSANTLWSAGNYTLAGGSAAPTLAQTATINSFALQDPYAGTSVGNVPSGPCQTWSSANANGIAPSPGVLYCNILFTADGQPNAGTLPPPCPGIANPWVLQPGVYYLDGGEFKIEAGNGVALCGIGVTIVLTAVTAPNAGTVNIVGGKVNLSAPLAGGGPFPGILFLQDPATANPALCNANPTPCTIGPLSGSAATLNLNGLIYTPKSPITFNVAGTIAGTAACTAVIARSIVFSGLTTKLTNTGCGNYGLNLPPIISVVLAE